MLRNPIPLSALLAMPLLAQDPTPDTVDVYVLAGQSNMVGATSRAWVAEHAPELVAPRDDVFCAWQRRCAPLAPGMGGEVGPELSFGHAIGNSSERTVVLLKHATGGTTLAEDWRPPRAVARSGGAIGHLYARMIQQTHRALARPEREVPPLAGQTVRIAGFVWLQGESDSFDGREAAYADNLRDLIADVREALAAPRLPVVIVQINDSPVWDEVGGGGAAVRAAQAAVAAADPRIALVATTDLGEGYHYSDGDHLTIGRRAADAMRALPAAEPTGAADLAAARRGLDALFFPGRGPVPPTPDQPLSARKWLSATAGFGGDPRVDRSIEGRPLSIDGTRYASGIGTHAESRIVYALDAEDERFVAVAGIDDEVGDRDVCSVVFRVLIDGETRAESIVMKGQQRWHFDVPIPPGSDRLTLEVLEADAGINSDHADWADAGFLRRTAPRALDRRGDERLMAGRFRDAVSDFDRLIAVAPEVEPYHWRRGIAQYYAGEFAAGVRQFELHRTVNGDDVENAAWHFLCKARADGVDAARAALLPVGRDPREPMAKVYELFRGTVSPEAVIAHAAGCDASQSEPPLFYAHLYVGLHHEVHGRVELARRHLTIAAREHTSPHYMGDVARMHARLLAD